MQFRQKQRQKQNESARERRRDRMLEDLSRHGGAILDSQEMRQAFRQKHHKLSTVGDHTMRVARASLGICYALDKLKIPTDIPAVVTGSLCHDLGILGRDEKYSSDKECGQQHPVDSVDTAHKLLGELPEKTEDIISRHMWPFAGSKPPNSLEAAIVSTADKLASVEDYVKGIRKKAAQVADGLGRKEDTKAPEKQAEAETGHAQGGAAWKTKRELSDWQSPSGKDRCG